MKHLLHLVGMNFFGERTAILAAMSVQPSKSQCLKRWANDDASEQEALTMLPPALPSSEQATDLTANEADLLS
jgi:hypothetical protein